MISVVICSITPDRYASVCENFERLLNRQAHEFIGIHDATSIADAYNRGVRKARGDRIILCHDDIEILAPDFRERLLWRLSQFDLVGVAGASRIVGPQWVQAGPPHIFGQIAHYIPTQHAYEVYVWGAPAPCIDGIKVMDGVFLAGHRKVFDSIPFDAQTFTGFHLYDIDFTLRASQSGFRLGVCNDFMLIHHSPGDFGDEWAQDASKFIAKHRNAFDSSSNHPWQAMRVKVALKEHLPELLRSPHWPDWRQSERRIAS